LLVADVEWFPHFIVPAGKTGRVVERSASLVLVAMNEPFAGGKDWDGRIARAATGTEGFTRNPRSCPERAPAASSNQFLPAPVLPFPRPIA
jgi:hypothetical protein